MTYQKQRTWKSKKYREWLTSFNISDAPRSKSNPVGQIVAAHQNLGYGKAGGKVSDSQCLPLYAGEHTGGSRQEHGGDKSFWGSTNRAMLCLGWLCRYLDQEHNVDAYRLALELLTEWMIDNNIK